MEWTQRMVMSFRINRETSPVKIRDPKMGGITDGTNSRGTTIGTKDGMMTQLDGLQREEPMLLSLDGHTITPACLGRMERVERCLDSQA